MHHQFITKDLRPIVPIYILFLNSKNKHRQLGRLYEIHYNT